MRKKLFILVILFLVVASFNALLSISIADAQMRWQTNGVPVCQTIGEQSQLSIVPDGFGGTVIGWEDLRNAADKDLYAQRLDASSNPLWTLNGNLICVRANTQSTLGLAFSVPNQKIFAAWEEYGVGGSRPDIFVQSLDLEGNRLWGSTGIFIARSGNRAPCYWPDLVTDGSGGVVLAWEDWVDREGIFLDSFPAIYGNRVNSSGVKVWATEGLRVASHSYRYSVRPRVIEDGTGGGMYVCWTRAETKPAGGRKTVMLARVNAGGAVQWRVYPGGGLSTYRDSARIISDGGTGCIVTWHDRRSGNWDVYTQRVDQSGTLKWGSSSLQISSSSGQELHPQLCPDSKGGTIICYWDSTAGDIIAQRVDIFGNLRWGVGVSVCQAPQVQSEPRIVEDDQGGCYIAWTDERNGFKDIYCQRLDSLGNPYFDLDGIPICDATSDQLLPQLCKDGDGGAICGWIDYRNGNADIYAQKIGGTFECGDIGFRPDPDGWQFGNGWTDDDPPYNGDPIMWPEYWWQQFDYCQNPYPWLWCFRCKSWDFPDWPLFVSAFGEDQCYYNPPPGLVIYKPRAVLRWFALKGPWEGSCFGFAVSSFLFFDDYLDVSSEFPEYAQVYSVPINDESRIMQNKYWIYQFGEAQQQHMDANFNSTTPNQTLLACQAMLKASMRDDRILVLCNNHGDGAHAVNPYRCEIDSVNPEIRYLYVYDNNSPNDDSRRISINTNTNTWTYDGLPGWGGAKHLFLMEPVSNYTINPFMPMSIPPRERWISEKTGTISEYVEFYISSIDTTLFESPAGSIGHIGDSLFTTLSDGHPIIPITGEETPPIGYYLPNDAWTCQFSGIADSTFRLSLFTDSTVMVYWRTEVGSTQIEKLRYLGNDSCLLILNVDSEGRFCNLDVVAVAPDSEIHYTVMDLSIDPGDSTRYSLKPASQLQLDNFGGAAIYDLRIEIAGINVDTIFFHEEITLDSNSSHLIVPDWRSYNDSLMILVDSGMVGSFFDTLFVENQVEPSHVKDETGNREKPSEFTLCQNYPNPFNQTTKIEFTLAKSGFVSLNIYDILGRKVRTLASEHLSMGYKSVLWDGKNDTGKDVASGIYFYQLKVGDFCETKKLVLLK